MSKFANGLMIGRVIGGAVGAVGIGCALNDNRTRRKMMRSGRKAMDRVSDAMENITDML